MSFEYSGVLEDKESDKIYRNIILGAQVAILVCVPLYGWYVDKADPRILAPATFFVRAILAASFRFVQDPSEWPSYFLIVTMVVISIIQFLTIETIFLRNMQGHIRGTLSGLAFFFGSIGTTTFSLVGGMVFDKIGPWAPFALVSGADFIVFCFALWFILKGWLGKYD